MPEPLIEAQIAAVLLPLVGNRVWPIELPQDNKIYPAVTYHRVDSGYAREEFGGDDRPVVVEGHRSVFQIVVWTEKYSENINLLRSIKNGMESIDGLTFDNAVDGKDRERDLYSGVHEYVIWNELDSDKTANIEFNSGPIADLIAAVVAQTSGYFGVRLSGVAQFDSYERNLIGPSIRLQAFIQGLGQDAGDGKLPLRVNFVARIYHDHIADGVDVSAEHIAIEFVQLMRYQKWGLGKDITCPDHENVAIKRQNYVPGTKGHDVWLVVWEQTLYVGQDYWASDFSVEEVHVGLSPKIGVPNEPDYQQFYPQL